ncbi:MAG: hypothetical protein ACREC5_03115 [Thermoplasmata archaeon]
MVLLPLEDLAGGLLLFVLPGLTWSRAVFPEWRFRGPVGITRAVETATLSFLLSVSFTILVGFGLTFGAGSGFPSGWSDPVLEAILGGIAIVGLTTAAARGGLARTAPPAPPVEPAPGSDSPGPLLLELARLRRDERRIEHRLRQRDLSERERNRLSGELEQLRGREGTLRRGREAEFAG